MKVQRVADAQIVIGVREPDSGDCDRDLSYDYLGKDKTYQEEKYPLGTYIADNTQHATEEFAKFLADTLGPGVEAFLSAEFENVAGTQGGVWFLKFPAPMDAEPFDLRAGSVGNIHWDRAVKNYRGVVDNWNAAGGRTSRKAINDPECVEPIGVATKAIADEWLGTDAGEDWAEEQDDVALED